MAALTIYDIALSVNQITVYIESVISVQDVVCQIKLSAGGINILMIESNEFDVFEGKQCISFRFDQTVLGIHDAILLVSLNDKSGTVLSSDEKRLQINEVDIDNKSALIHTRGTIQYSYLESSLNIMIGDVCFNSKTHYQNVYTLCKDYLTDLPADEYIELSADDISFERDEYIRITGNSYYSDQVLEFLALRRKISERLLEYGGFQIHGAAVAAKGSAVIFTADSGVGKTTHALLWLKNLPEAFIVNGDHPIIKTVPIVSVCGSPWCGKEGMNTNVTIPLKAIVIMERNDQRQNIIKKITINEALPELLKQVYRPYDSTKIKRTLELISSLNGAVDFYKFSFDNLAEDAFDVSYNAIFS